MSGKSIISNDHLTAIGNAIRYKNGTDTTYYPSEMADAIRSIEGIIPTGSIEISANDTYDVTEYASAVVDVQPDLRQIAVNENGEYQPDGFDGYSSVTVDVEPVLETLSCTENGLYLPETGVDGFNRVSVDVKSNILFSLDLTKSIVDEVTGLAFTRISSNSGYTNPTITPTGLAFTEPTQRLYLGEFDLIGKTVEIDVASMDFQGDESRHSRFFVDGKGGSQGFGLLIYRSGVGWSGYETGWQGPWFSDASEQLNRNLFDGKTVALKFYEDNKIELYLDGVLKGTKTIVFPQNARYYAIGACEDSSPQTGDQIYNTVISAVRIRKNT